VPLRDCFGLWRPTNAARPRSEYGIIVSLIFLAILSSVQVVGGMTSVLYELVAAMM
jgi:hypothetical protein